MWGWGCSPSLSPATHTYYSWSGLSSWVTTAGVNSDLVLNDPDAAVAAYPNADFLVISGPNYHLRDSALGVEFTRTFNPYTGVTSVLMTIFVPPA